MVRYIRTLLTALTLIGLLAAVVLDGSHSDAHGTLDAPSQTSALALETLSAFANRDAFLETGVPTPEDVRFPDLSRWHPEFRDRCWLGDRSEPSTPWTRRLNGLVRYVRAEPVVGAPLVDRLAELGIPICIEDRHHHDYGAYDSEFGLITLNDEMDVFESAIVLVHEARHVDQAARGFAPSLEYAMEEAARLVLACEADAVAVATRFAWELREAGDPEAWAGSMSFERYADIAGAFDHAIAAGYGPADAMAAGFLAWYDSAWRTDTYHRSACWGYLYALDETKLIPRSDLLPADVFDELCVLPDGTKYGCTPP